MSEGGGRRREIEADRAREAAAILARVERDGEVVGSSAFARFVDRLGTARAGAGEPEDAVEIWGRRIGRGLGLIAVVILIVHLVETYLVKP